MNGFGPYNRRAAWRERWTLKHHASNLIDPFGSQPHIVTLRAEWRERVERRFTRTPRARFRRISTIFDGWHGQRSPYAMSRLWRSDSRATSRVFATLFRRDGADEPVNLTREDFDHDGS